MQNTEIQNQTETPDNQRINKVITKAKTAAPPKIATIRCHEFSTSETDWLNQSVTEILATLAILSIAS